MDYPTIETQYGDLQYFTDYHPEYLREQDFGYDYAIRKFRDGIKQIKDCKNKMRFRFLSDIAINGVQYEYVEATCELMVVDGEKKNWINIFGKRKVSLYDPNFKQKFGQSLTESARKQLHKDLDDLLLSITKERMEQARKDRIAMFVKNTDEKINSLRKNIESVANDSYFIEQTEL